MRIKISIASSIALLLLAVGPNAMAQSPESSQWDVSILGGAFFPKEDDQDTGAYVGGRLTFNVNENVGVGGEAG